MSLPSSSPRPSLRGQFIDADIDLSSLGSRSGAALRDPAPDHSRGTVRVRRGQRDPAEISVRGARPRGRPRQRVSAPRADKDVIDRGIVDQEAVVSQAQRSSPATSPPR